MTDVREDIIAHTQPAAQAGIQHPEWLRQRLEWFQDLRFGLMMHWGPYCQWGCIESWPLVEADTWARPDDLRAWVDRGRDLDRFRRDYWALNRTFNPIAFDPDPWAEAARRAGMRYVAFTTKHHDGFCMFDTRATDYRITHPNCPFHDHPRADVTKAVFDAFRARGLAISCYFSKSDWHSPYYWSPDAPAHDRNPNYDTAADPARWAQFTAFVHAQVEELMTGYGPVDVLWLDGGQVRPPKQDIRMADMVAMARRHQPGLIVADRTVGGDYENILTPEQTIPDEPLGQPWESCLTMGTGWAYRPNDRCKPTRALIHMLADIASKGGNFLLNVGPSPEGVFPSDALDRLRAIGDWMAVNSEAIYGTRPIAPYKRGNVRLTCRGSTVYAIVLGGETSDRPISKIRLGPIRPEPGSRVTMLGRKAPLAWNVVEGEAEVKLPSRALPCQYAWVVKFRKAGG